jgi:hypothetical protein
MGGLKWKGDLRALNGFERLKDNMPETLDDGLTRCVRVAFRTSQVMVPKKTTALQKTGVINDTEGRGSRRSKSFTYGQPGEGDGIIDYAAAVHEILRANHAAPTQAKYVEAALLENLPDYDRLFRNSLRKAVKEAFKR